MAYNLNWLNADSNKDGLIKGAELSSAFLHSSAVNVDFNEVSFSYLGKINASSRLDEISIEEGLNERLMSDKNLDGNVSFNELYDEADLNSFAKTAQEIGNAPSSKKKNENEEDLLQKALSKGINSLNARELAEFKRKYPSQYERLGGSNELATNFKEDFLKQLSSFDFQILNIKA